MVRSYNWILCYLVFVAGRRIFSVVIEDDNTEDDDIPPDISDYVDFSNQDENSDALPSLLTTNAHQMIAFVDEVELVSRN